MAVVYVAGVPSFYPSQRRTNMQIRALYVRTECSVAVFEEAVIPQRTPQLSPVDI